MVKYHQGQYFPINKGKYIGNVNHIYYRSGLELKLFKWCDTNPDILNWNSEEIVIPYENPFDGKTHRYYMDVIIKYLDKDGNQQVALIEVKPYDQCIPPVQPKSRISKSYKYKVKMYMINQCKWQAAEEFAKKHNMKFFILTEKQIDALR